jgi:heme exporter protein C
MTNWIYGKWWKWLCSGILLYVLIGGMLVPLAPGVTRVEPITFKSDSIYIFSVYTSNSHLKSSDGKTGLWFKNGTTYFCPDSLIFVNDNMALAKFRVSSEQQFSQSNFDVVINNKTDGTFALREAVTLIADSTKLDSLSSVEAHECEVEVESNKHSGFAFPYREILYESIRNTFYHVPMWFTMLALLIFSLARSIQYLSNGRIEDDIYASQAVVVALLFGVLGLVTGMAWANYTWGQPWVNDPKLNGAAVGVIIYFAYIILRGSLNDEIKRAKISAVYNIFAVIIFILFIFVIPRLTDSLHPGNGGNPAFSKYDLDSTMRAFFYPAVVGWVLLGFWILSVLVRLNLIQQKKDL